MRILQVFVLCLLVGDVKGLFGIGRFFDSSRRAIDRVARVVEEGSRAYRGILQRDVIPELQKTLLSVRNTSEQIVKIADRLEGKIEETLVKVDELIERTGYRMDNLADLVIIAGMALMFVILTPLCDNKQFIVLYYSFQFIRSVCMLTGMMLAVRLICELVLRVHMSTASTIKYCLITPVAVVLTLVVLDFVYRALKQVGFVLIFILKGPRLLIYCTLDGPCWWTYGAYKCGPEMKSKKGFVLSIFLPWLTILIWFLVFHSFAGNVNDEVSEHNAFLTGLMAAYVFFWASANYLRQFHLRPNPQQHLRNFYSSAALR